MAASYRVDGDTFVTGEAASADREIRRYRLVFLLNFFDGLRRRVPAKQ